MEFCKRCDNLYYIHLDDDTRKLNYKCKKCKIIDPVINGDGLGKKYLIKTNIQKQSSSYNHIVNKFTYLDCTLPRITHIKCPVCNSTKEGNLGEIIFIRYDDINLKYIYLCCDPDCNNIWKI